MVVLIVVGVAVFMLAAEVMRPNRRWPRERTWWARAAVINGFQAASVFLAGLTWERWFHRYHLLNLSELGFSADLAIGYLVNVFQLYWSHRARHEIGFLWRWLHQLHHSPRRIEILTAFYKHPVEIVVESMIASALLFTVLGVSARAGLVISILGGTTTLFYHWNVATPRWLGYFIQRPESHCVHHQQGVHAYNYSELPVVDMLFGTFRNPATFEDACGFGPAREERLKDLLLGRDVSSRG